MEEKTMEINPQEVGGTNDHLTAEAHELHDPKDAEVTP